MFVLARHGLRADISELRDVSSRRKGKPMRKTQKKIVHRVDVRDPLEKLGLLNTKKPGQSASQVKKTGMKAHAARPGRWM